MYLEDDPEIKYHDINMISTDEYKKLVGFLLKVKRDKLKGVLDPVAIVDDDYFEESLNNLIETITAHDFKASYQMTVLSNIKRSNPSLFKVLVTPFRDLPLLVYKKDPLSKLAMQWRLAEGI